MWEYGITLTESKNERTEYMMDGNVRVNVLPYLISEAKKDFGDAHGNPYIQAAAYHLAATQSWLHAHSAEVHALPCIHIFYCGMCAFLSCLSPSDLCVGPVLGFAGSMLTELFDVNVLGPILPLFFHHTDSNPQIRCAKMFGVLKNSAIALKAYYEHIMPQSSVDTSFPWITQYNMLTRPNEIQEFKYLQWMDPDGLLCICQHSHDQ